MKLFAFLAALILCTAASAKDLPSDPEADYQSHGHYVNVDGKSIHSPTKTNDGAVPPGASAKCRDGSYSFSTHHTGTCSGHQGVAEWVK